MEYLLTFGGLYKRMEITMKVTARRDENIAGVIVLSTTLIMINQQLSLAGVA
jgi:hypothetical protein